jgi:hypothetical protein
MSREPCWVSISTSCMTKFGTHGYCGEFQIGGSPRCDRSSAHSTGAMAARIAGDNAAPTLQRTYQAAVEGVKAKNHAQDIQGR